MVRCMEPETNTAPPASVQVGRGFQSGWLTGLEPRDSRDYNLCRMDRVE